MKIHQLIFSLALVPAMLAAPAKRTPAPDSWAYLDNGTLRIGVDRARGAAIGYLALSKDKRNLLNHHDEGRFIQQSYYGDRDGSVWGKNPWTYNPVQGGSYKGEDAKTLDFRRSERGLYAKVVPLHWASAKPCPEVITYTGGWLAFVDDKNFGIGIRTPGTGKAVTYRHKGNGSTGAKGSACSYVAPVRTLQLKSGTVVDYTFYLTIGSLDEIRQRFDKLPK